MDTSRFKRRETQTLRQAPEIVLGVTDIVPRVMPARPKITEPQAVSAVTELQSSPLFQPDMVPARSSSSSMDIIPARKPITKLSPAIPDPLPVKIPVLSQDA